VLYSIDKKSPSSIFTAQPNISAFDSANGQLATNKSQQLLANPVLIAYVTLPFIHSFIHYYLRQGYVCVGVSWVVYLFVSGIAQKLLNQFTQKSAKRLTHGPWKKPSDFGGNQYHVTLRLRLGWAETDSANVGGGMRCTECHSSCLLSLSLFLLLLLCSPSLG